MQHTDEEFDEMEMRLKKALARIEELKAIKVRIEKLEKGFADVANLLDAVGEIGVADKIREALGQALSEASGRVN